MSGKRDQSYKVIRPMGVGFIGPWQGHEWCSGEVVTGHHMIACYSEEGHTRFDTVHNGRHCMRTFNHQMSKRGMAIVAARWSRELLSTTPKPTKKRGGRWRK